jgi:kinesin family protein C1
MKRKHEDDDEEDERPRKLSANGQVNGRPVAHVPMRVTRQAAASNGAKPPSTGVPGPAALTKPRAPSFSSRPPAKPAPTRATSLPPRSNAGTLGRSTVRPSARPGVAPRPGSKPSSGAGRTASSTFAPRLDGVDEETLAQLQERMSSLVQEQMDSRDGRIAADMDAERVKIAELQTAHLALSRDLAAAKTLELTRRKELDCASDELDALRKKHAREMMDVEADMVRAPSHRRAAGMV